MVDFKDYTYKMDRTLEVLQEDFGAVRAGRANARVLDRISVEYYGVDTPIGQVGTIASPDARTLVIQPWDGSLLKKIEKAIQTSDLGINPQNDGRVIRLVFPQLTEERRRELTKQVKKYGEDAKVAVRNIRRDAMDYVKALKKKSEITEDDQKKAEKDLQDLTASKTAAAESYRTGSEEQKINLYGDSSEDMAGGLLKTGRLIAHPADDPAGTVLSVLPGEHAYEVVFTGEYAGTPVKQDRLLPPLEIVPLTEAETN